MLKLKLQYFGDLMQRTDSLEKTLMLGKIEGRRRRDDRGWDDLMASLTQWTWIWVNSRKQWRTGKLECCSPQGRKESDTTKGLNNSNCAKNMFYIFENFYWWKRWCLTVNNSINIYWTSSICQRVLSYWEFSKKENRNSPYSLGFCILRKESN